MTLVGFYVVQAAEQAQRLQVAARLADKAFNRGHRIFINATDRDQAERLDELLWKFRPTSFLPHGLEGGAHDAVQPVLLCTSPKPAAPGGCLMSVDGAEVLPTEAAGLARICILFDGSDEQAVNHARTQWKTLTDAGLAAQYWAQDQGRWIKKSEKVAANA